MTTALMTPLQHLAAIRAAYEKAKARKDYSAMQYEAGAEMNWFARFNEDGSKRRDE